MAPSRSPPSDPPRVQMLLESMRSVTLSFKLWLTEVLSERGVTVGQFWTMVDVADHGPISIAQLAAFRCVTSPTISVLAEELVQEGYVSRVASAKDRRVVDLTITPRGRELLESVWAYVGTQLAKGTRDLPTRDIEAAVRVLNALQTNARVTVAAAGVP